MGVRWTDNHLKNLGLKVTIDGKVSMADRDIVIDDFKPEYISGKGVFIPHEVRSSKNSKQLFVADKIDEFGQTKKVPRATDSEAVKEYREKAGSYYEILAHVMQREFARHPKPYYVEFLFIRSTKAKWDFANLVQLPQDMMQEYKWLPGDDVEVMLPMPPPKGSPVYLINKNAPGLWIKVL